MNWMSLLAGLLSELSQKQNWAGSDKFGGVLHIIVPLAEGVLHAKVTTSPASAPVVTLAQAVDVAGAMAAIAAQPAVSVGGGQ